MSSDRSDQKQQRSPHSRVIKSHQVTGTRFAFPTLEQVAPGDLPPSVSTDFQPGVTTKKGPVVPNADLVELERLQSEARDAEARARAMERRAAAVLQEAEEAATARLRTAHDEAHAIIAKAEEAYHAIEEEAHEAGLGSGQAQGYAEGKAQARQEADALRAQAGADADAMRAALQDEIAQTRQQMMAERDQLLDAARAQVLELAFVMARQVLKTELALRPEAMVPMLEAALAKMKGDEEPQLRVSPQVLALIEEQRGRLLAALPGARRLGMEPDGSLEPGDFVVQGTQGFVDGRIDRQVEVLEEETRSEER